MSSDGSETSTGSRIRQFGLYRTIDARTDEFLKSSRKRQIRQGCACAAISTAITVTVVISVILVYEYSIKSESIGNKKLSISPHWHGIKNESDLTQMATIIKKKNSFDKTTLKLLPILLNALNKNRYLEKIINEYSSPSPTYESVETENYFKKNIFSDSKNWLKAPASKLYTTEYKTSPLIYLQSPSKRFDYLSRIRKIRNYERMLNYFDKMVNEKNDNSKTEQRFKKASTYTTKPSKTTYNTKKNKVVQIKNVTIQNISTTTESENITKSKILNITKSNNLTKNINECNCPKNIGQILKDLLQSLQELIPAVTNKKDSNSLCATKTKSTSNIKKIRKQLTTRKFIYKPTVQITVIKSTTQKITQKFTTNVTTKVKVSTKPHIPHYLTDSSTQKATKVPTHKTSTLVTILSTATQPSVKTDTTPLREFKTNEVTRDTLEKNFTHTVTTSDRSKETTTTLPTISTTINTFSIHSSPKTISFAISNSSNSINNLNSVYSTVRLPENALQVTTVPKSYTIDVTNHEAPSYTTITSRQPTTSINLDFSELRGTTEIIVPFRSNYVSYDEASSSPENTFDAVAVVPNYKHPIEPLFKDEVYEDEPITPKLFNDFGRRIDNQNLISTKSNKITSTEYIKSEHNNLRNNIRKMGLKPTNYHPVMKNNDVNMRKMSELAQIPNLFDEEDTSNLIYTPIYERGASKVSKLTKVNSSISNSNLIQNFINLQESIDTTSKQTQPIVDNENTENVGDDEYHDQLITHRPEVTEAVFKKSELTFDDEHVQDDWDKMKSDDKINHQNLKSMLPPVRPTYLEVRRNGDWKTEHTDYDINLANNIFDLP